MAKPRSKPATDEAALVAAVLADLDDDAPLLVFGEESCPATALALRELVACAVLPR